jgi:anti-sigma28 factor (negative regulator of flagellin synthesis)
MDATIITKVSQIILESHLGHKLPKQISEKNGSSNDTVQISSAASEASKVAKGINNADAKRTEKVAAIREKVASNNYKLTDEMVDEIAKNIAKMFV